MSQKLGKKKRQAFAQRQADQRKRQLVEKAIDDSIKDNLAERVIDNFVGEVSALPFEARFKFALAVIRGNEEDAGKVAEELAKTLFHAHPDQARVWDIDERGREMAKAHALALFKAAGIEE